MNNYHLFAAPDSQTLFVIGVALIVLVLIRILLRPKRDAHVYESPLKTDRTPGHMLDAPADIGHWEVEMYETARNLMGELNTKIAIVEQLVRDANAAAERLEKAIDRANKSI